MALADANDAAAARDSLNATLRHWGNGETIRCDDWVNSLIDQVGPLAADLDLSEHLQRLTAMVSAGNQAMQWVDQHRAGRSISDLLRSGAEAMEHQEQALSPSLG